MACMIHDIDCRLGRSVRHGKIRWVKRKAADYRFMKRLEQMHINNTVEDIYRYVILFMYRVFTMIIYDLNFRDIMEYVKSREYIWDNVPEKNDYEILKDIRDERLLCFEQRYLRSCHRKPRR